MTAHAPGDVSPSAISDALRACEAEPIRTPGTVQPHGGVLLCAPDGRLLAASESVLALLGFSPAGHLGQPIADLLGRPLWAILQQSGVGLSEQKPGPIRFAWEHPFGKTFDCWVSWCAEGWLVDFERRHFQKAEAALLASARTLQSLASLEGLVRESDIASHFAQAAQSLLGFDHVLVYRFHEDWHGEVIAESTSGDWDRWIGLHWPASDIPSQARALYVANPVRQIPDVDARPSPLRLGTGVGQPDLALSALRSTSPYHLQYMRNMGVRASLVGSLIDDGGLWGLVACHNHASPLYTCAEEREAFAWLCRELMLRLARRREVAKGAWRDALSAHRARALEAEASVVTLIEGEGAASVMGLAGSDGVAWVDGDNVRCVGLTPPPWAVLGFAKEWTSTPAAEIQTTSSIGTIVSTRTGPLRAAAEALLASGVAGIALARVAPSPARCVVWFRQEWRRDVRWGGNPNQPVTFDPQGRPWPRSSFASWLESIRGDARPWQDMELESIGAFAREFRRRSGANSEKGQHAAVSHGGSGNHSSLRQSVVQHRLHMKYQGLHTSSDLLRPIAWCGWPWVQVDEATWRPLRHADWHELDLDARASLQQWLITQALIDRELILSRERHSKPGQLSVPAWIAALPIQRWQAIFDRCKAAAGTFQQIGLALDVQDGLTPATDRLDKARWLTLAREAGLELRAWGVGGPEVDLDALSTPLMWHSVWWRSPQDLSDTVRTMWQQLIATGGWPVGCTLALGEDTPSMACAYCVKPLVVDPASQVATGRAARP